MSASAVIDLITSHQILDTEEPLHPESDLLALGLDSLAIMQLLLALETHAGRSLAHAEISREHLRTPSTIAAWIAGMP
jgi:aryl carrier-like protein